MKASVQLSLGFSTLDALAALMVLNMLCLGVLAMQLLALQAQRDALAMQAAVGLAQDLWERMQLFPQASMSYQLQLGQVAIGTDCKAKHVRQANGRNLIYPPGKRLYKCGCLVHKPNWSPPYQTLCNCCWLGRTIRRQS